MSPFLTILFAITIILLISSSASAQSQDSSAQTFIVRIQNDMKPDAFPSVQEWYAATIGGLKSSSSRNLKESGFSSRKQPIDFLYVYRNVFHGFSVRLTPQQAQELKTNPGVLAVLPDRIRQIETTRSPEFLGLPIPHNASESDLGSDVIIGVLDTGIWPERRSFHDEGLGPIPSHWKGACVEGENFTKSHCNKKLIGARYFVAGYDAANSSINLETNIKSARDTIGHGTHTASTAAGRAVTNASLFRFASGVAIGMAPKARLAVYKVCWKNGCTESDILAGIDKAVEDGVDIISISIGGIETSAYSLDPIAIGSFAASEKGIFVSASAGNSGPTTKTVINVAPWMTTVGASTIDRRFPTELVLENGPVLRGMSLYTGKNSLRWAPLIYAGNASEESSTCEPDTLNKDSVKGKIVICDTGDVSRVAKGEEVQNAGGIGVIVANMPPAGEELIADAYTIPGLQITESGSQKIHDYINSNPKPRGRMVFHGTEIGVKPAPVVASFSSRGPNTESISVLKPDVLAPGVNILAAWPDDLPPTSLSSDARRTEFNIVSGTSMSCPHVSGIAALLKGAHPDWSPAMIRSALMTTAYTQYPNGRRFLDEASYNESVVWDTGAGHVNPAKALDPGLVYDISTNDYIDFLCASNYTSEGIRQIIRRPWKCEGKKTHTWNLNYPAIVALFDKSKGLEFNKTLIRTVTHVAEGSSSYKLTVVNPKDATVMVNPSKLRFEKKGQKLSFVVNIEGKQMGVTPGNPLTEWGKLTWSDGKHEVVLPIVVYWVDRI